LFAGGWLHSLQKHEASEGGGFGGFGLLDRECELGDPLCQIRLVGLGNLLAQLNQAEQDLVALRCQLVDRARADFGMNAIDQLLLNLRSEVRVA